MKKKTFIDENQNKNTSVVKRVVKAVGNFAESVKDGVSEFFDSDFGVSVTILVVGTTAVAGVSAAIAAPIDVHNKNTQIVSTFQIEKSEEFNARMSDRFGYDVTITKIDVTKCKDQNTIDLCFKKKTDIETESYATFVIDDETFEKISTAQKNIGASSYMTKKGTQQNKDAVKTYYDELGTAIAKSNGWVATFGEK